MDSSADLLTIGEVAKAAGVRPSAIRYYEESGLLRPAARVSGRRHYDAAAVDQLRLIGFAQQLGFSLAEIRQLLTPPTGKTGKQRWRELVDGKLEELEAVIARARQMKRVLNESRDCDCVSLDACRFLREPPGDGSRRDARVAQIGAANGGLPPAASRTRASSPPAATER